jgi:hypothetical protein
MSAQSLVGQDAILSYKEVKECNEENFCMAQRLQC